MLQIIHFINGQEADGQGRYQDVYNPATGQIVAEVALGSVDTVEQAIACAKAAFPAWRATPPLKRAQVMFRFKLLPKLYKNAACLNMFKVI